MLVSPLSASVEYVADLSRQTSDTSYSYRRNLLVAERVPLLFSGLRRFNKVDIKDVNMLKDILVNQ
jgi:hypothetical protein